MSATRMTTTYVPEVNERDDRYRELHLTVEDDRGNSGDIKTTIHVTVDGEDLDTFSSGDLIMPASSGSDLTRDQYIEFARASMQDDDAPPRITGQDYLNRREDMTYGTDPYRKMARDVVNWAIVSWNGSPHETPRYSHEERENLVAMAEMMVMMIASDLPNVDVDAFEFVLNEPYALG